MKLFKKLAAVALAAVLALSMVGCGNASSVNSTKQLILNMMADSKALYGAEYHNTPELDSIAQRLLTEANAANQGETQANKTVKELMQEAAAKEGVLKADTAYAIYFAEEYQQSKSSFIPDYDKQSAFMERMFRNCIEVKGGIDDDADELDVGIAVGKIGDKTYVVMVMMPTATTPAPSTPDRD
mgnify:CR=1 FL=1